MFLCALTTLTVGFLIFCLTENEPSPVVIGEGGRRSWHHIRLICLGRFPGTKWIVRFCIDVLLLVVGGIR